MKNVILFDLDGVLARFTDSAYRLHGRDVQQPTTWNFHYGWGMSDETLYRDMGRSFWSGLDRWEDGFLLLWYVETLVGSDSVLLCTSPVQTEGCVEGKRDWVKKHVPSKLSSLTVSGRKDLLASPRHVLIDDSDANCERFVSAGGRAFLVPRPWNESRRFCDESGTFNPIEQSKRLRKVVDG